MESTSETSKWQAMCWVSKFFDNKNVATCTGSFPMQRALPHVGAVPAVCNNLACEAKEIYQACKECRAVLQLLENRVSAHASHACTDDRLRR